MKDYREEERGDDGKCMGSFHGGLDFRENGFWVVV